MMLLATLAFVCSDAWAGPLSAAKDRLGRGNPVVWVGLDYSTTLILVPEAFDDPEEKIFWGPGGGMDDLITRFAGPRDVWSRLTTDWNAMFLHGLYKKVEKALDIRMTVALPDPDGQTLPHGPPWFLAASRSPEFAMLLTDAEVKARAASWKVDARTGTGFGILVERLSKEEDRGCAWPVIFDLASREVLYTERLCSSPSGIGFRNYWFNPLADIVKAMVKKLKP